MRMVLAIFFVLSVVGCVAAVGGATFATTKTRCLDGSTCDNPYVCSMYAGKPCEAPSAPPTAYSMKLPPDARTRDAGIGQTNTLVLDAGHD